ncbi:MAG: indolepyruvate oxidoreductase subunit beta [Archangium sp.]|nr:indolepyruvate oxidoreductase subunit beta [Archangium sp.]
MNFDLVLCGVGGQGVLSTAYIVDHAAVDAGLHFKQPEVHGMAQRGGAVSAQVRLSDRPVSSDLISEGGASAVLSVEPLESLRYMTLLRPDAWVITDVTPLKNIADYPDLPQLFDLLFTLPRVIAVDATRLASKAGAMKAQNMVVLGAAAAHLPLPVELLEKHLGALFGGKGERIAEANRRAFRMGQAAEKFSAALRAASVAPGLVARVVARLSFEPSPAADDVVKAWAERLNRPDGAAFAARVFASRDLLPLDAALPSTLS